MAASNGVVSTYAAGVAKASKGDGFDDLIVWALKVRFRPYILGGRPELSFLPRPRFDDARVVLRHISTYVISSNCKKLDSIRVASRFLQDDEKVLCLLQEWARDVIAATKSIRTKWYELWSICWWSNFDDKNGYFCFLDKHLHGLGWGAERGEIGNPVSTDAFAIDPDKAFGHGAHVDDDRIVAWGCIKVSL